MAQWYVAAWQLCLSASASQTKAGQIYSSDLPRPWWVLLLNSGHSAAEGIWKSGMGVWASERPVF